MRTVFAMALFAPGVAIAAPIDLAHSGRLLDGTGAAISGPHDLEIVLLDGAGTVLATRSFPGYVLEDGYYGVTLTGLDSAWFSGTVEIEVRVDGAALGPAMPLVSVPHAAAADVASSVPVAATGATGACTGEGSLVWDRVDRALKVCDDAGQWVAVGSAYVEDAGGYRLWSDGTHAVDCDGYRHPIGDRVYDGATGDGVYRIDPDGPGGVAPFDVYCDMTTDGGGWTLLLNLASRDTAIHDWADAWWTGTAPEGTAAAGLSTGHKSAAFANLADFDEVMVFLHDAGGTTHGYAIYDVLAGKRGTALRTLLASGGNDQTWTGTRRIGTGTVGAAPNTNRSQSLSGDLFLDHPEAIVLNKTSGWSSATNRARIATTLSNGDYVHTYAGLGGEHFQSSWGVFYESAPISPYCSITVGYGDEASYLSGNYRTHPSATTDSYGSRFPYRSNCRGPVEGIVFEWKPVDTALFVR